MKILRFLQNFLKIYRIFRENLRTNPNYAVVGGSGGGAPRTPEKISNNFIQKLMKNYIFRAIFQNFNENFAIFTKFLKNFSNLSLKFGEN